MQTKNIQNGLYKIQGKSPQIPKLKISQKIITHQLGISLLSQLHFHSEPKEDKDYVVNLDRDGGDKSISILEGTRFVFNKSNWNKPAFAICSLTQNSKRKPPQPLKELFPAIFRGRGQ
ncbi:MAG: hypothetical protein MZV64_41130 [Ignavibacteriales bacterium]|nr:hypothetical protein [Ignavibacteriales bacterium]